MPFTEAEWAEALAGREVVAPDAETARPGPRSGAMAAATSSLGMSASSGKHSAACWKPATQGISAREMGPSAS